MKWNYLVREGANLSADVLRKRGGRGNTARGRARHREGDASMIALLLIPFVLVAGVVNLITAFFDWLRGE